MKYTLVMCDYGNGDRYEALYADGRLVAQPDGGGAFSGASMLEAIASSNATVEAKTIEVSEDYDTEVLSMDGYPELLDEIPAEAVAHG